jgi:general nucleoside transport system permease protein
MIAPAKSTFAAAPLYAALTSILVAVALIAGLFTAVGVDPLVAANVMWKSTFGSLRTFGEGLIRATPLLMISATLLPSLRAGLYNIGAPGQLGAGALAATLVALGLPSASSWIVVPLCAIAAFVAGGAAAFVPGLLKAHWRVNEIVSTLAMNFIVVAFLGYLLNGPLQSDFANLPQLLALDRSLIGYRLRLFSINPTLAKRASVDPKAYITWLITFGGAGAGLAGWMQVAAIDHRLYPTVASPIGYAGLFVALLGALHPLGSVVAAFFLGALLYGGAALQVGAGVSPEIIQVFLGLILFIYASRPGATR